MSSELDPPVRRRYRSALRQEQARATRTRIARAAATLFAENGWTRTSVSQIARTAGTSVETIYGVGGKAEVFLRAFELAFSGTEEGADLLELPEMKEARNSGTLAAFVEVMVAFIADSNQRSVGLWLAYVEAGNAEPTLGAAYARRMQETRADGRRVLDFVVDHGLANLPSDPERTVDEIWAALHPMQYVLLVRLASWRFEQYTDWLFRSVMSRLAEPGSTPGQSPGRQ